MDINIAIADDHAVFKQGIEALIKYTPGMHLTIKANNGMELLDSIKTNQPDVILLDLRMPVMDGLTTLSMLKSDYPQIKVIILTLTEDSQEIGKALENGAVASLTKNANPDVIIRTIKESYKSSDYGNNKTKTG